MFQFPGFAPLRVLHTEWVSPFGNPRIKAYSQLPTLIAAYHVLHRLLSPRHPPNALKTLDHSHYQCSSFSKPQRLLKRSCLLALPPFGLLECVTCGQAGYPLKCGFLQNTPKTLRPQMHFKEVQKIFSSTMSRTGGDPDDHRKTDTLFKTSLIYALTRRGSSNPALK
jgi:hypothetical protein